MSTSDFPTVPQYQLIEKLGSGTYATVYKALRNGGARDVVAVKCISKKGLTSVSTENLLKEIELLKSLKNPHVVSLIDFVWDAKYIHLILEFCPGGDLFRFIKQRCSLSETVVRRFLQQLSLALHYLHSQKVVHMDLKPQNILLTQSVSPKLKIADFGFAHHLTKETHADQVRGSLLYMAPEIVKERRYSPKCDLWSVGIILYECLFGHAPFHSSTYEELHEKILSDSPIILPTNHTVGGKEIRLSDNCQDLLARLLQRDPKVRIDYDDFFAHPFVDLEHAPSTECLRKGKSLVLKAVNADKAGLLDEAFVHYKNSLTYLVPGLHYEDDPKRKDELRKRIYEYMTRAESIRFEIENGEVKLPFEKNKWDLLVGLSKDSDDLIKYLEGISTFNDLIIKRDYEAALAVFESTCDRLLSFMKSDPHTERKKLLAELIDISMGKAESLKDYLKCNKTNSEKPTPPPRPKSKTLTKSDLENEENDLASNKSGHCGLM